ncbi:MAG: universal stress protein [Bacteroidia bacterium]|nr:universal stress protein [Bacteroidia bacterium]
MKVFPIRKILVPTDFSDTSRNALHYAVQMALRQKANIVLFHAAHVPAVANEEILLQSTRNSVESEAMNHLEALKLDMVREFGFDGIEMITSFGFAVDEINTLVKEQSIDLIVMGTRGASGLSEILIGSNTAEVIEHCVCPVLVVPENARFRIPEAVAFATNYADNDFQSLYLLTEMMKPFGARIAILHIENREEKTEVRFMDWFKGQVQTNIPYSNFSFHLIQGSNLEETLNDFVMNNGISIVAVAMRKRSFFDKLTNRSFTKKMVYHSDIPLLAFHAKTINSNPLF